MKKTIWLATAVTMNLTMAGVVAADHANPWASEDDTVLAQYHDENQARSEGTPGMDEMNGVMTRSARGKLDADLGGGAAEAAAGGHGNGNSAGGAGAGANGGGAGGNGAGGGTGHGGRD